MKFNKSPFTLQQQIHHLKTKFQCNDEQLLRKYLLNCNYYRLSGYWSFFEEIGVKISFKEIISLYEFDTELKSLFLEYIGRIEISIKSIFAYHLTTKYNNSHIHLHKDIFMNLAFYEQSKNQLKKSFLSSKELFVKYFKNYDEESPPLWASVELMTLGEISKWYSNLNIKDKKEIASYYEIKERYLSTFLLHLTEVRNLSAHHSRLWNRKFSKGFQVPSKVKIYPRIFKIYHTAVMMDYLLSEILQNNYFFDKFIILIQKYNLPLKYMGFDKVHNIETLKNINYEYKEM